MFDIGILTAVTLNGLTVGAIYALGALGLTVLSGRLDRRDGIEDRAEGVVVAAH